MAEGKPLALLNDFIENQGLKCSKLNIRRIGLAASYLSAQRLPYHTFLVFANIEWEQKKTGSAIGDKKFAKYMLGIEI